MPQSFVSFAEVKQAVTMEAILSRYGLFENLSRKGKNLAGQCPFCKGKSARQFQVNPVKNAWYCFGCKAGGNILDFVAKHEGVSVRTAALKLDSWFELGLAEETEKPSIPSAPVATPKVTEEPPPAEETLPAENPPSPSPSKPSTRTTRPSRSWNSEPRPSNASARDTARKDS